MRPAAYTDFSLHLLIYLTLDGGLATIAEVAEIYGNIGASSHDTVSETIGALYLQGTGPPVSTKFRIA